MDGDRDLQLLLLALRNRVIDPTRLADAIGAWDHGSGPGLMAFLAGSGVIAPDDLHRLEAETVDQPTAVQLGDPLLQNTPNQAGYGENTIDSPARGGTWSRAGAGGSPGPAISTGRYKVVRLHQTGGLGKVWLARDTAVGRDVALKTLRPDRAGSPVTEARFIREARLTGQLEHPSIVPLYDLAGGGPEPFYVMRFVSGRTMTEAAADYHARRADGRAVPLDLNTLLDAFVSVCRAVAFAHSRSVLHRDLKGQNIVVGEYGEVFLLDWGLAKPVGAPDDPSAPAADDGDVEMTAPGAVVGTAAYMAPEVAAGAAATKASDVYGLGAILYALLTGGPPYAGANAAEVRKKVTTIDPASARAANPSAPAALEAVCRKAMARNPADRYASAEDVATDVRRWLADEPVAAYREPWPARAARWARRRKTMVVAAGVLLVTAALASSGAAALVWREQHQTKIAWKQAEAEQIKATENADTAITVVRDLSQYVFAAEFSGGQAVRNDQQRKVAIDVALASYERLLALHPDDANVRRNVARLNRLRANLSRFLNETTDAEKFYREAKRHYGELASAHPEASEYREEAAQTLRDFGQFMQNLGRLKEATKILDDSIRVYEELRQLNPLNAGHQRLLANMLLDRSDLDYQLGRFAESERAARKSVDLYAQLAETPGARPETVDPLFRGMSERWLGMALREQGRIPEAIASFDIVVERMAGLTKLSADRNMLHQYHRAQAERAWTFSKMPSRYAEGVVDLNSAILGWEKLSKQFPQVPLYLRWLAIGNLYRGRLQILLNEKAAATIDLNVAAKILEGMVGKYPDIPAYRSDLGQAWTALGQLAANSLEAVPAYQKAREMLEGAVQLNPENVQYRQALSDLDALTKMPKP
jgi:eukaryotic-like serine/threonine-protein kinase